MMDVATSDCSRAWLDAIQQAMVCVNTSLVPPPQDFDPGTAALTNGKNSNDLAIQASIDYLALLETILLQEYERWNQLPSIKPPKFKQGRKNNQENAATTADGLGFQGEDGDDEGGDVVMLRNSIQNHLALTPGLVMRRLAIRVLTSQSELYAQRASQLCNDRSRPQWKLGAETYQTSLEKILEAIELADSEISRLFSLGQNATDLAEDANVVHIAISFFANERERFLRAARAQEQRLLTKLQPQWSSRDDAKSRIGDHRWTNNPRPKNDYRKKRLADERQLKDVQAAVKDLTEMDDAAALKQNAQHLQRRLLQKPEDDLQQRYNGLRPTDMSKRVSMEEYPDPTNFGWTFTGSWQYTEFFERDEVKLDWYYTTATIKTSMDHPSQGRTQLFGSRVTPAVYRQILLNPRKHTNVRYHTRRERNRQGEKQN